MNCLIQKLPQILNLLLTHLISKSHFVNETLPEIPRYSSSLGRRFQWGAGSPGSAWSVSGKKEIPFPSPLPPDGNFTECPVEIFRRQTFDLSSGFSYKGRRVLEIVKGALPSIQFQR
jgi:hypothetical protein